jgi:hypothetical protein
MLYRLFPAIAGSAACAIASCGKSLRRTHHSFLKLCQKPQGIHYYF